MLLAYHDRSDGGLFATLCEMAFAGALRRDRQPRRARLRCGGATTSTRSSATPTSSSPAASRDLALRALFAEELGAVLQVRAARPRQGDGTRCASAGLRRRIARHRPAQRARRDPHHAQRPGRCSTPSAIELQRAWSRDHATACSAARQPGLRARGVRPHPRRRATRACRVRSRSIRRGHRCVVRSPARARASRSCASRASTARSRWRRRSTAPASRRSTCT